jgi:hypothetical protein
LDKEEQSDMQPCVAAQKKKRKENRESENKDKIIVIKVKY